MIPPLFLALACSGTQPDEWIQVDGLENAHIDYVETNKQNSAQRLLHVDMGVSQKINLWGYNFSPRFQAGGMDRTDVNMILEGGSILIGRLAESVTVFGCSFMKDATVHLVRPANPGDQGTIVEISGTLDPNATCTIEGKNFPAASFITIKTGSAGRIEATPIPN